jgi:hypothetical protein
MNGRAALMPHVRLTRVGIISWQMTGLRAVGVECGIGSSLLGWREEITDEFGLRIEEEKNLVAEAARSLTSANLRCR